uniref:hypothetical protein n=1 Tax=Bacteroides caecimuris TaxID=1796613 RepID=UPI0025B75205
WPPKKHRAQNYYVYYTSYFFEGWIFQQIIKYIHILVGICAKFTNFQGHIKGSFDVVNAKKPRKQRLIF